MSGQMKVKSLSLSRRTQTPPRKEEPDKPGVTEENEAQLLNLDAILNSPIARPSRLCSTPIQKNVDPMEESPDQDYRCSPTSLFPCTQDSNEIAWDWQSGVENKSNRNNNNNPGNLNHTPKRPQQLFPKKRTAKSYSPLLNVPNKRKLANLDVAESIGKFAAELTALAEKIKTEQRAEFDERKIKKEREIAGNSVAGSSDKEIGIFDLKTQASFDIHQITTLKIDQVTEAKTGLDNPEKVDSSLDDLFDDSVDACMIQCSQEIEDKFKLGLEKPNSSNETRTDTNSASKSCSVNIESRYDSKMNKDASISGVNFVKEESGTDKEQIENIPASQIPDDSFEDCLALCLEEGDELIEKFMESSKAEIAALEKSHPPVISKPLDSGLNFKRKQQCMGSDAGLANTQSRKYFKTKSLSDSHCGNSALVKTEGVNSDLGRSYPPPTTKAKTSPNFGNQSRVSSTPNLNNFIPAAGGGSNWNNNFNKPGTSGSTVSYSYLRNVSSNSAGSKTGPRNLDPYSNSGRRAEKPLKDLRNNMPSSSQYSAEEIEKKRLEARMKLEANKMKKQMIIMQSDKKSLVKR